MGGSCATGSSPLATAGALDLPWIPSLVFQALHTGAPWSIRPTWHAFIHSPDLLLGGQAGTVAVLLAGGAVIGAMTRGGLSDRQTAWR